MTWHKHLLCTVLQEWKGGGQALLTLDRMCALQQHVLKADAASESRQRLILRAVWRSSTAATGAASAATIAGPLDIPSTAPSASAAWPAGCLGFLRATANIWLALRSRGCAHVYSLCSGVTLDGAAKVTLG